MARVAVRESVTLAERARAARAFVSEVLGPGHPCGDVAVMLVSEVFSNSVRHSGSCAPGETVTVAVSVCGSVVRVEVTDRAGPGRPELRLRAMTRKAVAASARFGPGGAVGLAAARRANGDLVRASAPLLMSPLGELTADMPGVYVGRIWRLAGQARDAAMAALPPELPRFAVHLEMHRGLMLARAGEPAGGATYAREALAALPPEKHYLTLRMLMAEIEAAASPV